MPSSARGVNGATNSAVQIAASATAEANSLLRCVAIARHRIHNQSVFITLLWRKLPGNRWPCPPEDGSGRPPAEGVSRTKAGQVLPPRQHLAPGTKHLSLLQSTRSFTVYLIGLRRQLCRQQNGVIAPARRFEGGAIRTEDILEGKYALEPLEVGAVNYRQKGILSHLPEGDIKRLVRMQARQPAVDDIAEERVALVIARLPLEFRFRDGAPLAVAKTHQKSSVRR